MSFYLGYDSAVPDPMPRAIREGAGFEAYELLPDGVLVTERDGRVHFANSAARALFTLAPDALVHEALDVRDRSAWHAWLGAGTPESLTVRLAVGTDDAESWVTFRSARQLDGALFVTIRPVTPTVATDRDAASLLMRAAMLESVLGASPLGMYMVPARSDRILWFSHRLCEIWKMEHLEAGMRAGTVSHSEVLAHCATMIVGDALSPEKCAAMWREAKRGSAELEVTLHDGRAIRWIASPVRDDRGHLVGMLFLDEDITERRRIEDERMRASAQFRTLIETALEAILVNRHGVIVYANPTATALLGYAHGDDLRGLMLHEIVDAHATPVATTAANDGRTLRESHWLTRDGRSITVESSELDITFRGAVATLLIARDVTERNEMRAQLLQADRLASVGTLAAGVAHELNNPIAYMLLNLEYIRRGLDAELARSETARAEELLRLLADTTKGAEHVRDIVRDLKTFSRPDDARRSFVDVRNILDATLQMAKHQIEPRARVVREFDEVPPVNANESRLAQVFLNLVLNAVQALPETPASDAEIRLGVHCPNGRDVVISIHDNGTGIDSSVLPRVFDPFFTTKPVGVGTGLGLSICHGIVTALDGRIEIESSVGEGTTVRVILPVEQARELPDGADSGAGI